MIVLRHEDNASEIELDADGTLVVRLPENATTGFQWEVVERPNDVELVADTPIAPALARAGEAGEHEFCFRALRAPAGRLVLELRRSWEHGRPPLDTFAVTVRPSAN
jgi:inhibitor of cysteine peptidase